MSRINKHFSISERKLLLRLFDLVFVIEGLALISFVSDFQYFDIYNPNLIKWIITLSIYLLLFGEIFELYNLKLANERLLTVRSVLLVGFFTTLFYVFTPIISPELPEKRIQIFFFFLAIVIPILIWRYIYRTFIFSPLFFKKVLLIGSAEENAKLIDLIREKSTETLIIGYISPETILNASATYFNILEHNIEDIAKKYQVSEIVVQSYNDRAFSMHITPQLIRLFKDGYHIISSDSFKEGLTNRIPESRLNERFYNYLSFSQSEENRTYLFFHRFLDIVWSLIGIVFLLIIIPFVLVSNLFGNKGPLFFLQERVGKGEKLFKIIKLRTMVVNAEKDGAVWATAGDTRITKFGRFLRKTRIDEIPQFINVLKGDMSLIGPRPERPEFVDKLEKELPFYSIRHVIKPGLTGWAQVEYPYASTMEEQAIKLRYDLFYIKKRNLIMDFRIVLKTFSTILFFRGT